MSLNNEFKIKNDSNTLGRILSGGVDIASILTTNTNLRTLTGTLLPTSIYQNASGNWQSTYLTVSALSASWGQGGTNLAAVTNYLSTNNVLISGLRVTDNLTVVGSISTLNNGTSQQWRSTYTTVNTNSGNWNTAYNTATTYQLASSSFATNTLLQNTSGLLTPLTLTRTLTGLLVTTSDFSTYRTSVANSTATLLPTTIYQQTSGGFALSGYNTTISDTVSSVLVGGASPQAASVWKTRSIIQVLDTILFPDLTASYTPATISISPSPATTQYEVGEIISVTYTGSFTRNDAGGLSAMRIQRSPLNTSSFVTLSTTTNPVSAQTTNVPDQFGYTNPNNPTLNSNSLYTQAYTDTAYTVIDGATYWRILGDYRRGLPKPNNKGAIDTRPFAVRSTFNPQLSELNFTSTNFTITGRRKLFFSNDSVLTAPANSTQVRALTGVIGSGGTWPGSGTVFDITIFTGTKRVVFAYPQSFGTADSVQDLGSLLFYDIGVPAANGFNLTTASVSGANSLSPVTYNIYTYLPVGTFNATTLRVTI